MFIADVTHDDIISQEGSLELYLGDLPNWEKKIENAKRFLIAKLKNAGRKIRLLNTELFFENAAADKIITNSGSFTSEKTDEDIVERLRFIISLTALASGTLSYKLQGTDDSDSEVWTDVVVGSTDKIGEFSHKISRPFKYYQLVLSGDGSRTFSAYLVEDVFFLPVLLLTIAYIYLDLKSEPNSNWEDKYREYMELFNQAFESLLFSYDKDDDDTVEAAEVQVPKTITILR